MSSLAIQTAVQTPGEPGSNPIRPLRPAGMIDLAEGVRRAMSSERYTGTRTPAAARSWVRRLAAGIDDPQLVARPGGKLWLCPTIHPAFREAVIPERTATALLDWSEGQRKKVATKMQALSDLDLYRRARRLSWGQARKQFVRERAAHYGYRVDGFLRPLKLTVRSLQRWQSLKAGGGPDALADTNRGRYVRDQPSTEAVQLYWRWRNDPRRFGIADCWRKVALEAEQNRWRWFGSYESCKAWDRRTRDERQLTLNREGEEAYTRKCESYIEPEPDSFEPGQCWIGDDHTCDVWVKLPSGDIIRPVLSAWQDWRSRAIIGWQIVRTGNEHSLLLAFGGGAERHAHIPGIVIADNGKNFTSWQWRGDRPQRRVYRKPGDLKEQIEGIFALCGIEPRWALPYNPNGKARLERWFGTFERQLCKNFPSYCGSCSDDRPDEHKALVAQAVDWDCFIAKVGEYILAYNDRPHSAEDMIGRTPLQVLATATSRRVLPDNVRPLLLAAWQRPVSIGRNGVSIRICGLTVRYGADDPALTALAIGTPVRVSYDPNDIGSVVVWSMDYRMICRVECNQKLDRSLPTEALREQMHKRARQRRTLREANKVGLEHMRDPKELAIAALNRDSRRNRLPDPPPDGRPALVPVLTPLEVPERHYQKQAVGAEGMDAHQQFIATYSKPTPGAKRDTAVGALYRLAKKQAEP